VSKDLSFIPSGATQEDIGDIPVGINERTGTLEIAPADPVKGPVMEVVARLEAIRERIQSGYYTFSRADVVTADVSMQTLTYDFLTRFIRISNEGDECASLIFMLNGGVESGDAIGLAPGGEIKRNLQVQGVKYASESGPTILEVEAFA